MAVAGRERTRVIADLDEVAEGRVGLVGAGLVAVVAVERRHRLEVEGELQARWGGQRPGAAPVRVGGRAGATAGERPAGLRRSRRESSSWRLWRSRRSGRPDLRPCK